MRAIAGAQSRLHYGWIVAAISFMTLLVAAGIRSAPGVLIVHLEQDFGWSRATLALPISIGLLLYGLVGPFSAGFIERFGLRAVMLTAVVMFDIGFGLTPLISAAWHLLLLWGVLVGCGTGMTAMVLAAIVAGRWFVARRGMVMGLLTASSAAGQLIFMRDRPGDVGLGAYGEPAGELASAPRSARANPFAVTLSALGRGVVSRD